MSLSIKRTYAKIVMRDAFVLFALKIFKRALFPKMKCQYARKFNILQNYINNYTRKYTVMV